MMTGMALGGTWASSAQAQDFRSEYMVRLLTTSSSFRVRSQAALTLGEGEPSAEVIAALSGALTDRESAVRVAAASSLRALGDPAALPALRAASDSGDFVFSRARREAIRTLERAAPEAAPARAAAPVPTGPARFYVGLGDPQSSADGVNAELLGAVREVLLERLQSVDGVVMAPEGESSDAATRVTRRRRLTGYFVGSSVTSVGERDGGIRADVSVILYSYPGRAIRAMLRGGATVMGARGPDAVDQAVRGAVRGAMRSIDQVMIASTGPRG